MDYKYIQQLLERYWKGETSLQEEEILRSFFSQKDIPADLIRYKALFAYEQQEKMEDVLGDDFDEKILSMIEEPTPVKARVITMRQRMMPLFKAAAIVAIFLTLGNAAQVPFNDKTEKVSNISGHEQIPQGNSVAMGDSAAIDTLQQSNAQPINQPQTTILK